MALSFAVTPFIYPPDWNFGIQEHLEWKTDVLTAHDETEQRRGLRTKARRSFEYTLHAVGPKAAKFGNFLSSHQNTRVAVPVWTDKARLEEPIAAGGGLAIVSTTGFSFAPGQLVCFYNSEDSYEFARISFMGPGWIELDTPMQKTWSAGTLIFPAVLAMLPKEIAASRHTSSVLTCSITLTTSPDITYSFTPTDEYPDASLNSLEIVTTPPNWRDVILNTYMVNYDVADGGTGAIVQMVTAPKNRESRQYGWLLKNRSEIYKYRNFLGRIMGQLKAFYVPSWYDDFVIVSAAIGGYSVTLDGTDFYDNAYDPDYAHNAVRVTLSDGSSVYRNFTLSSNPLYLFHYDGSHKYDGSKKYNGDPVPGGGGMVMTFDTPVIGTIVRVQLLKVCRSQSDKITLDWKTDSIVEVTNTFITTNA